MMKIDNIYVMARYRDFVEKYQSVLARYNYDPKYIESSVALLSKRLEQRDFKRYGDSDIHYLHAGKRITRNFIRNAIMLAPARKSQITHWRKLYADKCAAMLERQPWLSFFSFEHAYSAKLRINFSQHRRLFYV